MLDYESLLKGNYLVQTICEVTIHKCEPRRFVLPLAAAREQALENFETLDIPSHIQSLAPIDQIERIGVLKSGAEPALLQADRIPIDQSLPQEQPEIDPNLEVRVQPSLQEAIWQPQEEDRQVEPNREGENKTNSDN